MGSSGRLQSRFVVVAWRSDMHHIKSGQVNDYDSGMASLFHGYIGLAVHDA